MGLGAAVVAVAGFLGGGAIATFTATVITYAVVGAAIGGLTSAVMGGDIGKGILYGAIGGAVMGGVSAGISWYQNPGTYGSSEYFAALKGGAPATGSAPPEAANKVLTEEAAKKAAEEAAKKAAEAAIGDAYMKGALVTSGGQMLMKGFDKSGEIAQEEGEKNRQAMADRERLQAENLIKVEEMKEKFEAQPYGNQQQATEFQLLNQRESREQSEAFKNRELNELEEARLRRANAFRGMDVASVEGGVLAGTKSVNEQASDTVNKAYPTSILPNGVLSYA